MKTTVQIVGIEQVNEILNELPKRYQKQVLRSAMKKVTPFIRDAAIQNVMSERVKKQIEVWPLKRSAFPGWWIGWSTQRRKEMYDAARTRAEKAWAWMGGHWLEYGTSGRGRGSKSNKSYRVIQPIGWFRRAVDMNINKTESEFMNFLHKDINKFLDRKIKKGQISLLK